MASGTPAATVGVASVPCMTVAIITDSACDLPADLVAAHQVRIVPLSIRFGDEEFTDGLDLSASQFWAKCKASSTLPETAAPSPGAFQTAFESAREAGASAAVCINISGDLSGTIQAAKLGAEAAAPFPVSVVDSRAVSMAQGILVILAAKAAAAGAGADEVVALVEEAIGRLEVCGVIDTMEHLQKSGRVGGAKALLGSVLAIKPILKLEDGVVAEAGRQRTRAKAVAHMLGMAEAAGSLEYLALMHGACDDLEQIEGKASAIVSANPLIVADIGPVVGTHGGPGIIAMAWLKAKA